MAYPVIAAEITFLTPEQGGRSSPPCQGYRPDMVVESDGGTDLTGYLMVALTAVPENQVLGEPGLCELALYGHSDYCAVQEGARFTLREGPHVVAHGRVLRRTER